MCFSTRLFQNVCSRLEGGTNDNGPLMGQTRSACTRHPHRQAAGGGLSAAARRWENGRKAAQSVSLKLGLMSSAWAGTLPVNFEAFAEDDGNKSSQLRELYRLIHALNPLERALILLWLEERSYDEIARIVGISKNNVGVRLNRIREKLKNMSNQ